MRREGARRAVAIALLGSLVASAPMRFAFAQDGGVADSTTSSSADSSRAAALPPRQLLSTDGSIRVYAERRPGEGINGFWWEYDPKPDLERLLDKDRRTRPLDPLTDAYGFAIVAPESISALRDSVTAVADSILTANIRLAVNFDPKLTTNYIERKDSFDFTNELTSPVPISSRGTIETTVSDTNSFNESTRKVRDGRTLASTFSYQLRDGIRSSVSVNRNEDQQRRDDALESRSNGTSVNGRVLAARKGGLGDISGDLGFAGNSNQYETEITDGSSNQLSPSWHANFARSRERGKVSLDYSGDTALGRRKETRTVPQLDENGIPLFDEFGNPLSRTETTETKDRNLSNKLDLAADRKLNPAWTVRVNGSVSRERTQFIAPEDSLRGRQETRTNKSESVRAHVEGKPTEGVEILVDGDRVRTLTDYDLGTEKLQEVVSHGANAEVRWDIWTGGKVTVKLNRDHQDRNYRSAQAGFVDKEMANLNWKQTVTQRVELTANYDISLDSFVFDDKVANIGDRDLRTQRGVFTVRYTVSEALNTAVNMDLRHDETVNVNPASSRNNKTDYTYLITPNYSLRMGRATLNGEFGADARYAVYDLDEEQNFLTRRFSTRHRLQQAITQHISAEFVGTYEVQDEGSYRRSLVDGIRRFAKARETRRQRVESQLLYSPKKWCRSRISFRRDGDDQFSVRQGKRNPAGEFRTHELTVGLTLNRKVMRSIRLDLDFDHTQKRGDRVTDVDRRFYTIRAALEYQPFRRVVENGDGS